MLFRGPKSIIKEIITLLSHKIVKNVLTKVILSTLTTGPTSGQKHFTGSQLHKCQYIITPILELLQLLCLWALICFFVFVSTPNIADKNLNNIFVLKQHVDIFISSIKHVGYSKILKQTCSFVRRYPYGTHSFLFVSSKDIKM